MLVCPVMEVSCKITKLIRLDPRMMYKKILNKFIHVVEIHDFPATNHLQGVYRNNDTPEERVIPHRGFITVVADGNQL